MVGIIYLSPPHGDRGKPICILGETILKSCLCISCFLSFLYPSKFYKNMWTGGQVGKIPRKLFIKVWSAGKKLSFYFMFSFCPSKLWQKVWTGGQVITILKKKFQPHVHSYLKVWTFGQEGVFLFHVFFLLCSLHNFEKKKCGQVGQWWKFVKNLSIFFILLLGSVDLWTIICICISFLLLSTLYPSKFWQKSVDRWTSNEILRK